MSTVWGVSKWTALYIVTIIQLLDLRNNPGGLLNQAVEVSDTFLNEGLIVYTQGRDREKVSKSYATNDRNLQIIRHKSNYRMLYQQCSRIFKEAMNFKHSDILCEN